MIEGCGYKYGWAMFGFGCLPLRGMRGRHQGPTVPKAFMMVRWNTYARGVRRREDESLLRFRLMIVKGASTATRLGDTMYGVGVRTNFAADGGTGMGGVCYCVPCLISYERDARRRKCIILFYSTR